jgi:uncharacterized membrane protein YraQ (UPF0718 family)
MKIKKAANGLLNNMKMSLPILTGILLLIGLINAVIPGELLTKVFTGRKWLDPIIGALIGGVAAGNPLTSYIIGGELLKNGIGLTAVLAFILSWVTVGTVQLPAESLMLGKNFALARNGISFVMAIAIALLTVGTIELL